VTDTLALLEHASHGLSAMAELLVVCLVTSDSVEAMEGDLMKRPMLVNNNLSPSLDTWSVVGFLFVCCYTV